MDDQHPAGSSPAAGPERQPQRLSGRLRRLTATTLVAAGLVGGGTIGGFVVANAAGKVASGIALRSSATSTQSPSPSAGSGNCPHHGSTASGSTT